MASTKRRINKRKQWVEELGLDKLFQYCLPNTLLAISKIERLTNDMEESIWIWFDKKLLKEPIPEGCLMLVPFMECITFYDFGKKYLYRSKLKIVPFHGTCDFEMFSHYLNEHIVKN